jgi:hypothetical protein
VRRGGAASCSSSRQRKTNPDLFRLGKRRLMPAVVECRHLDLAAIGDAGSGSSAPAAAKSMYWSSSKSAMVRLLGLGIARHAVAQWNQPASLRHQGRAARSARRISSARTIPTPQPRTPKMSPSIPLGCTRLHVLLAKTAAGSIEIKAQIFGQPSIRLAAEAKERQRGGQGGKLLLRHRRKQSTSKTRSPPRPTWRRRPSGRPRKSATPRRASLPRSLPAPPASTTPTRVRSKSGG